MSSNEPPLEERVGALDSRERQVMQMIVAGLPNKAIARRLDVGERTVDRIRSNVFRKLGVTSAVELARVVASIETGRTGSSPASIPHPFPGESSPQSPTSAAELKWLACEIHDGLAQELSAAMMHFETAENLCPDLPVAAANASREGRRLLARAAAETRRLIHQLHQHLVEPIDVIAAVEDVLHEARWRFGVTTEFIQMWHAERLAPALENAILMIVREAVFNAGRHSASPRVCVELAQRDDRVTIVVRDWGQGLLESGRPSRSHGLAGIRARAEMLGGHAEVRAEPRFGTKVSVVLPLVRRLGEIRDTGAA